MMRDLYQTSKLIHGDLSEYNILWHENQLWLIDVSQSVENQHPMALDFLRRDCIVINNFFSKHQVYVLSTLHLFNFITDISITDSKAEEVLNGLL